MMRRLPLTVALFCTLFVAAGGCTQANPGGSPPGGSAPGTPAVPALSTIASIADLQKGLEARGIGCKLEYEGLRDDQKVLSLCNIDGEQATLTIWLQPEVLDKFLASPAGREGVTAVGRNWTVDVRTAAVAQKIAAALGGTVKASPGQ